MNVDPFGCSAKCCWNRRRMATAPTCVLSAILRASSQLVFNGIAFKASRTCRVSSRSTAGLASRMPARRWTSDGDTAAVIGRRTALDYAEVINALSHRHFPAASKVVVVQENFSTHKPASLSAAEERRLAERFEWHLMPKHGRWLDMSEIKLSVMSSQCLAHPRRTNTCRRNCHLAMAHP
jgi:DDE superfamily endonuclease